MQKNNNIIKPIDFQEQIKVKKNFLKGISLTKNGKYTALISKDKKRYYLGTFKTEAAKIRDKKAIELYGNFAKLNFI